MADLRLGALLDPTTHQQTDAPAVVRTSDLVTHAVVVGMTGSGKTGLGVVLVEEVLRAGVPCLLIDPKGDLTNLALLLPELSAAQVRPWVDEGAAATAGITPDELAVQQATQWREGLARWDLGPADVAQLRADVEVTIYTPGSRAGRPLDVVGSLAAPPGGVDPEVVADEVEGYVSGLLGLVGIEADPLASREHILLSNLIETSWAAGRSLDLPTLIGQVQSPPMRKLGVFDLESFFPKGDRTALAMRLNGLLASPSFSAWMEGDPLDVDQLLRTPDGRPRAAVVTIAHLSDAERQFVVTLLLAKVVTWMRRQSGTTDLRALISMDEVAGYVPPVAQPPTKKPILTLMKQARAFGVGVVLATQNPVDLDYKAIGNAGTWLIGRLQTERDRDRLLDGMAAADGSVDRAALAATIGSLGTREFVLRQAGSVRPQLLTSRWALSYLRGPLTRDQIASLTAGATPAPAPASAPAASIVPDAATPVAPDVAGGIPIGWVDPAAPWLAAVGGDPTGTTRSAAAVLRIQVRFDEARADLVVDQEHELVVHPLTARPDPALAHAVDHDDRDLLAVAPEGTTYLLPDAPVATAAFWRQLQADVVAHLVRTQHLDAFVNKPLKLASRAGEDRTAFAARCAEVADAAADDELAELREGYARKAASLQSKLREAQDRTEVLAAEASGRQQDELLSAAGGLLGQFLGGRRRSGGLARQVSGAARRRAQARAAGARVEAAQRKAGDVAERLNDLDDDLHEDVGRVTGAWAEKAAAIEDRPIALEKADVQVTRVALGWVPVAGP